MMLSGYLSTLIFPHTVTPSEAMAMRRDRIDRVPRGGVNIRTYLHLPSVGRDQSGPYACGSTRNSIVLGDMDNDEALLPLYSIPK